MATLLSYTRQSGCWDFFSQPNLLALLSCLQDSTNEVILNGHEAACLSPERAHSARVEASPPALPQLLSPPSCVPISPPPPPPPLLSWQIRDLASELLIRYFPATFPEPIALALFQLAQEALGSPRVQEAEAGAVLMKTILQKYELLAFPLPAVARQPLRAHQQHQHLARGCIYSSGQRWLGFENSLAVGSWVGLGCRTLSQGRKEPHSPSWAEKSLVLATASAPSPRSDSDTMKSLALEAKAAPTLPNRGLCFAQHLLHVLQAQYAAACQDLLQAAATAPMHGTSPAQQGSSLGT